ncbi:MAG: type IV toxin-antitoxin system AbiEi family antitoxin domain-containing protein [Solirubrobacterales bacterium]
MRLAERQHGVVSRQQLRALGMTDTSIAHALSVGRLHPVFHGIFALGRPRLGSRGLMLAATLACGPGTVVSHRSAARLLGLWDSESKWIDVIAPVQSGRKIDGIHRSFVRHPREDEQIERDGIPCTTPSRTIVDIAGRVGAGSLRRTVERAAQRGMLDPPAIDAILARGRRRGSRNLRAILVDWRQTHSRHLRSDLEALLLPLIVARGLPAPLTNFELYVGGEVVEVDLFWPKQSLVVEADSRAFHGHQVAFERDRDRDRDLTLAGYRVLRVTWRQLEAEPARTVAAIARALAP